MFTDRHAEQQRFWITVAERSPTNLTIWIYTTSNRVMLAVPSYLRENGFYDVLLWKDVVTPYRPSEKLIAKAIAAKKNRGDNYVVQL